MKFRNVPAAAFSWAMTGALAFAPAAAQAQTQARCIPAADAQAVAAVFLPSAVRAVRTRCAPMLSRDAYLKQSGDRLLSKLDGEARGQFRSAMRGINRIAGTDLDLSTLPPEMVQPLVDELVRNKLGTSNIDSKGCKRIDRGLALVDPLPASSLSGLLVMVARLGLEHRSTKSGRVDDAVSLFKICDATENK